jgi:dipeptidyl aminopeptidase/acylaminoacyl peptidase
MMTLQKYDVPPLLHGTPVDDSQISPDGKLILFVRRVTLVDEDRYDTHIWIVPTNGSKPKQMTSCEGSDTHPRWSPDGETIYFLSTRGSNEKGSKKARIWAKPLRDGEARLISEAEHSVRSFQISPDGSKILFLSRIEVDSETPEERDPEILWINKLRYKYDGEPYFPYTRVHLFICDIEGSKPLQVTDGPYDVSSPSWSPDSEEIAFVAKMEEGDLTRLKDIYIVKIYRGLARKVTDGSFILSTVTWSPDGGLLTFAGRIPPDPLKVGYGNTDVWVISPDGGEVRNLTSHFDRTVGAYRSNLLWSRDSKYVYFRASNHGTTQIYKVSVANSEVSSVTDGDINVSSFSLREDGSVMSVNASDTVWPDEIWLTDEDGTNRLTNLHGKTMQNWSVVPPEEFWFKASDGVRVQGWLVRPRDFDEGKKYPMVLEIHGGPHGAYGFKLGSAEHEFQLLAANGYVVVYTNPRDSIGYGVAFAGCVEGNWGSRDYEDLMEAVDYVLESYNFIDDERLGVAGGSFGGFMTNWTVTHTKRFKAAVTMRSVASWYSQVALSDVGWGRIGVGNGLDPWEAPEQYLDRSPLTYVKDIETPLLIIHSENDYRCPMPEGEKLFVALKRLRKETEFVRFYNEPHGLSRMGKPSHRTARLRHILRWFDKYLK